MMPTYLAPMHTDRLRSDEYFRRSRKPAAVLQNRYIHLAGCGRPCRFNLQSARAFTLTELVVVLLMVSLFVLLAQTRLFGLLANSTFRAQAQELVSTMQMAASAAAETGRRYEIIIDLAEQNYLLRQITTADLSQFLEEEIIVQKNFGYNCKVIYIEFDDGDYTNEGKAKFRAGHAGWQYGGKIVLLDRNEKPYSISVNRINTIVKLHTGDVELMMAKIQTEVPF